MLNLVYPNVHQYWPFFSSHITEPMFLGDLSMTPMFHAVSGHAQRAQRATFQDGGLNQVGVLVPGDTKQLEVGRKITSHQILGF